MNVAPGATYEAVVEWGTTGLVGTLGMEVLDNEGGTSVARLTTNVIEIATGVYSRTGNVAPSLVGQYTIVWDDGTDFVTDELNITGTPTAAIGSSPSGRDLCTLGDVCMLIPGYSAGDDSATDAILQVLITEQSRDAMERTGREITPIETTQPATRLFDLNGSFFRRRKVKIGDAADIDTVKLLDIQGNELQTLTSNDYALLPRVREDWQPYGTIWFLPNSPTLWASWFGPAGNFEPSFGIVSVTATWGFPAIPDTVRDAVARLVLLRYLNDVAAEGTELANALNRADFNLQAWWRQALDALDRFQVPSI